MSSTKFADHVIEKVPMDFNAPFVDYTLLCLFDKYVFCNFDNYAWDNNVCDNRYEDAVDNHVDTFFRELIFLTKKPNPNFCGLAGDGRK